MAYFIYSTCTNAHNIAGVHIQGGHGLPDKHLWTPRGVVTEVTDEQYAKLKEHRIFKALVAGGNMTAEKFKVDPKDVAKDLTDKDGSAQATESDFKKSGDKNQKVAKN